MKTLTTEYDVQSMVTLQNFNGLHAVEITCLQGEENEFDRDLKRSISGDELISRLSTKIHKMFKNGSALSSGS